MFKWKAQFDLEKASDPVQNPRPLKVSSTLLKGKSASYVMQKKLKNKTGRRMIESIYQDLTLKQREARKLLVAEVKQRKANGERDLIIFNGKVVQ